jgi:GNAT superfamily N-acetyltransferase
VERLSVDLLASTERSALFEFLESDELRHITPLKMLTMFGNTLSVFPIEANSERGVVFVMPRAASQWDTSKYPSAVHSVYTALPATASESLIAAAAQRVLLETRNEPFVVKTIERRLIERLQASGDARMPMHYALALLTFTPIKALAPVLDSTYESSTIDAQFKSVCYEQIPQAAWPLLNAHDVYSKAELSKMFADGTARCWLRFVRDEAKAVLLTFANSKTLHEIGSLYVHANARRARHAQALVRAALDDIDKRGLKVRYVVDATNNASISLAQQCGLCEALRAEHWYTTKAH